MFQHFFKGILRILLGILFSNMVFLEFLNSTSLFKITIGIFIMEK